MNLPRIVLVLTVLFGSSAFAGNIEYWNTQRKGANFFPLVHRKERFEDAAKAGLSFGRLACSKWLNGRPESQRGDFLIGPKDQYSGIVEKDLKYLIQVLDDANKAGVKIVLTMLSLPGSRWLQHNCINERCQQQYDLWKDFKYHEQSASFWRDLARVLKDHPALAAYNIINEPIPERANKPKFRDWYTMDYEAWYKGVKGTPADLNLFYKTVIKAIREVDQETPIVLDSGFYANPYAFQILDPKVISDEKVIYSFHHYEPSRFATNRNKGKYTYPGNVPSGELDIKSDENAQLPFAPVEYWDNKKVNVYLDVISNWMAKYKIPANRVYAGEFGAYRDANGVVEFFRDNLTLFNSKGWHWSIYSFREDDGFPQMDYELGTGNLSPAYWECSKNYTCEKEGLYKGKNPLWKTILDALK